MSDELLIKVDKLKINDGDTVIVKSNDIRMDQLSALHRYLQTQGHKKVTIIKLNFEDSIEKLDDNYKRQLIVKWQEELK